ncbi:MAG: flagellar assembly peptidoglycan hydrolase FlgJ [Gammaproteobacteria bacterium]
MVASPAVYTDLVGLAHLRREASRDHQAALPAVAQQFEGLFLQMLLKSMRQTALGDPLQTDPAADVYRGLYDQQLSLSLARARGIGLADMLVRELGEPGGISPPVSLGAAPPPLAAPRPGLRGEVLPSTQPPPRTTRARDPVFDTPQRFVQTLLPQATRAAQRLGVAPQVLIAQAALETGWGRAMIRHADGTNSFNLFGIKADGRWPGARVVVPTLEFVQGVMERRPSAFRAYTNISESFDDYVDLIRQAPRYQAALASGGDAAAYVHGLQAAGYATDPRYAEKVLAVMASPAFRAVKLGALASLD